MRGGHSPGEILDREQQSCSPSTMTSHPDHLEVKQPQAITLLPPYFTVMMFFCEMQYYLYTRCNGNHVLFHLWLISPQKVIPAGVFLWSQISLMSFLVRSGLCLATFPCIITNCLPYWEMLSTGLNLSETCSSFDVHPGSFMTSWSDQHLSMFLDLWFMALCGLL